MSELVKAFKDARVEQARQAAMALARMGPAAKKAAPHLIAGLRDRDPVVRAWCAQALGEFGASEETARALFDAVTDPIPAVQQAAGLALARGGRKATPHLRTILRDMSGPNPAAAAEILALVGPDAVEAVPELLIALEDFEPTMRAAAAKALGALKGRAKEVVPSLAKALAVEKSYPVQQEIIGALARGAEADVPGFMDDMRKLNREGGWAAPFALPQFGPRGADAVKPLIKMLQDPDVGTRVAAAAALGQIGPDALEALPPLQALLRAPQPELAGAAAQAIFRIEPRLEEVALKHFLFEIDQAETVLNRLRKEMEAIRAAGGAAVFDDVRLQQPFMRLMDFHLYLNSAAAKGSRKRADNVIVARITAMTQVTARMVNEFGPEGIPALVAGINKAAAFRLGFC
ncbi:MAG: HEAT repeat domain-containing protein [Gemmataceae bacterium]